MPSLNEGFGLPVIEAINSGIPVVASDIPIFREILGNNYPHLASPRKPEEWIGQIRSAISSSDTQSGYRGYYNRIGDYYREHRAMSDLEKLYRTVSE